MAKQHTILLILAAAAVAAAGLFYWYEWRPTVITKECAALATTSQQVEADRDNFRFTKYLREKALDHDQYELCLRERGL